MWPGILCSLWVRWRSRRTESEASRKETGDRGETVALRYLRWRGWRLMDRNWRTAGGEIDLIVRRGRVVAFVEVRSRQANAPVAPEMTVTPKKQRHIRHAAKRYLAARGVDPGLYYRFDIIAVEFSEKGRPRVTHFPDAFRES